jgi:ABC-type dipeptide/oligopeptide/nickel transport system permease subunit
MKARSAAVLGPASAAPVSPVASSIAAAQPRSTNTVWRRALRNRRLVVGSIVIVLVVAMAVFADYIAPFSPYKQTPEFNLKPPFWQEPSGAVHLFGTDALGRDILSRIIYGARVSLVIGAVSVLLAGTIGVVFGLVAGYFGGGVEAVVMRLVDTILSIPFILLAVLAAALFGQSLLGVIAILGFTSWVIYARVVRGTVLSLKEVPYVEAARSIGAGHARTLTRHILPGVWAPIIVVATQQVGAVIIAESSLTFLGLGVPPDIPSWGGMIADGRGYVSLAWWVSTLPGLALMLTVLAVYFFGDGLRDVLDPRLRL